jgi:IclR-like helix-turn-helix domain-containing protein
MPAGDFLCGQGETNPWTQSSRSGHRAKACPPRARSDSDRHSIQSVDRALVLLETIAEAGGEASLTDLANRTGLNISTCHHLLTTLIQRGFAAKMPGRRLYALGGRILYLGHACLQVDLPRRAQPYLETINQATGETVHLAALQATPWSRWRCAKHATPCGPTPARSEEWKRRTPPRSAKPSWPGCRRTRFIASLPGV